MCGIVGYVGDVDQDKIHKMLNATSHRGPDDSGIFIKDNVGLGSNRLAIIDLSHKGHQPMFDDKREICIVYNGEMYNFMEIKQQLKNEYKFKSNSDTEVIIYAYKKWGIECLKRFDGMFSFVIYDIENNLLFGARDRIGEKPLKYYFDNKTFIFSSEVKSILSVLKSKPEIDIEAINDYLTLQYVPAPKTGFKDIYKLPPASYFIFKNNKLKINKYWSLDYTQKNNLSEVEWVELLESKVNQSVKSRMVSDVPIGSFLSGGVDSSAVTAFMSRNSSKRISTFNIGIKNSKFDESEHAKKVSKLYKTDHSTLMVDSSMFQEEIEKTVDFYDEPFADNSTIPSLILSRFTKKKVTVCLSGDGGDENFAGYDRYNIVKFGEGYKHIPIEIRNNIINPLTNLLFDYVPNQLTSRIKTFSDTSGLPFYEKYMYYKNFFNNSEKNGIYSIYTKKLLNKFDSYLVDKDVYDSNLSDIDNALNIDVNSYLPEGLMYKTDIASMSVGLEVRSPLLDYKLLEFTAKMPDSLKIKNFNKKYIFKKMLLDKNILPKEIVNRPKQGFVMPIAEWLKNDLKDIAITHLNAKKIRQLEIFDNKKLDNYINDFYDKDIGGYNNMFALIMLSMWINKYF